MKKVLLVIGVLAVFFGAIACTKQEEPAAPAAETEAESTMPEEAAPTMTEEEVAPAEEAAEATQPMVEEPAESTEAAPETKE